MSNGQPSQNSNQASGTKPEQLDWKESFRLDERKEENPNRVFVSVTSFRRRLLDHDNLFEKYFIDALRYSGFIRDDTVAEILQEIRQVRVVSEAEERTEITIVYPEGYKHE